MTTTSTTTGSALIVAQWIKISPCSRYIATAHQNILTVMDATVTATADETTEENDNNKTTTNSNWPVLMTKTSVGRIDQLEFSHNTSRVLVLIGEKNSVQVFDIVDQEWTCHIHEGNNKQQQAQATNNIALLLITFLIPSSLCCSFAVVVGECDVVP